MRQYLVTWRHLVTWRRAIGAGWLGCALAVGGGACSPAASSDPAPPPGAPPPSAEGPSGVQDPTPSEGISGLVDENETTFVPVEEGQACLVERADAVQFKEPVDIILLVDNSASMVGELAATERNINENFASILAKSALDYRVIAITLHRWAPRTGFGQSATMLCVERPLSGLADCTAADEPVFSDRFFQYSTRVESDDSFDILLDTYAPPFELDDREDQFGNAPLGWSAWLRPGVKKVFLELTDDNENMSADEFAEALSALAPEHFGADPTEPEFVFHSIVGMREKPVVAEAYLPAEAVQSETCVESGLNATSAGEVYQELSRRTGGLRFPICQSSLYDVVFRAIAGNVVLQSDVACDFPLPEPPRGRTLDLDRVSVSIEHSGGGASTLLGQARVSSECQGGAFFLQEGRIQLCPEVCTAVRGEEGARVDVLFGCESSIIVR